MSIAVNVTSPEALANRRYASRRPLRLGSVLADSGVDIVIHDISATGLLIEASRELPQGETIVIDLPERGATSATVAWQSGNFFGCQFELGIPAAAVSAALLRSPGLNDAPESKPGPDVSTLQTLAADAAEDAAAPIDDRYSLRTRGLVIVGLTGLSWAVVIWVASLVL